jgi:hypothetical protein
MALATRAFCRDLFTSAIRRRFGPLIIVGPRDGQHHQGVIVGHDPFKGLEDNNAEQGLWEILIGLHLWTVLLRRGYRGR